MIERCSTVLFVDFDLSPSDDCAAVCTHLIKSLEITGFSCGFGTKENTYLTQINGLLKTHRVILVYQ